MSVINFIVILLEVLLLFNLLIFVHELGHFLAARWRGLKIERFAIWFGKPIWKTKINGVEYCLGSIPAGGYVSLPQMATMETIEGKTEETAEPLPNISPLDKIIVAFAGPLFSFLLALVFAVIVMFVGRPVSEAEMTTVVGFVEKDGPADKVGIKPGDKVISVDGKPVTKFSGMGDSVMWRVVRSEGESVSVKVDRQGQTLEFHPVPVKDDTRFWQRKSLKQIKVYPAQALLIAEVTTNSPAEAAGIRKGDELIALNNQPLYHFEALLAHVDSNSTNKFTLKVKRADKTFDVALTPEKPISPPDGKPRIGVKWEARTTLAYPGAGEQVVASVNAMLDTFGALLAKDSDIKPQHLGGAVKIIEVYYRLFDSEQGWRLALWFSVLMNVNLAILNLLPIPVLDGGHITLALIEWVRRRPLSAKIVGFIQTSCAVLLIGFMLYIVFYDVQDLPWKRAREKPVELRFAPKTPPPNAT
jgi:regulator of sigma E protease